MTVAAQPDANFRKPQVSKNLQFKTPRQGDFARSNSNRQGNILPQAGQHAPAILIDSSEC